ncbi:MAG: alpha/beta hydrolase [Actinomycetes bacterium]
MRSRALGVAVAVWGTALTLVAGLAAAPSVAAEQATAPVPRLEWQSCGASLSAFLCATAEVPTDYDDPTGPTTTIGLTKLPAAKPDERLGTLFTNPGGPGGSGVDFVQQLAQRVYDPQVLARFDVLGFDPRGVGASDPATCFPTQQDENVALSRYQAFPLTDEQEATYVAYTAGLGAACTLTSPERFDHDSTANVARDMDLLRQAVGDEKLTYAGYSYGTFLGATYARLFPDHVRAMVLDGTLEPTAYTGTNGDERSIGARTGQGPAAHVVFGEFLRLCAAAGPDRCALAALGDPGTVVDQTFERLKTKPVPVPVPGGTTVVVDYQRAVMVSFLSMYSPALWSSLAETIAYLATASGVPAPAPVAALVAQLDRAMPGTVVDAGRREDYPSLGGSLASLCADVRNPMKVTGYPALADQQDAVAPYFGRARAWVGLQCSFLHAKDQDAYTGTWDQATTAPVLVIGTRFDPATPYWMTQPFARHFPDARVLTHDGWGHTTLGQNRCAEAAVARYLVDLQAQDGATCPTDVVPFAPKGQSSALALLSPWWLGG